MKVQLRVFVALTGIVSIVSGRKILPEKPDFITSCKLDASLGSCFAHNLEMMFREWRAGIPGLKSIASLDPLHIKRVTMDQGGGGPIALHLDLKDALVSGLSRISFQETGTDPNKLVFKFKVLIPKYTLSGDYTVHGNILSLVLNGKGKAVIEMEKAIFTLAVLIKLRKEGDLVFGEANKVHADWTDIGAAHVRLDNLFNGDKALEESAHAIINGSWRTLFEVLRQPLSQTIEITMKDVLGKILNYVPAPYLLEVV